MDDLLSKPLTVHSTFHTFFVQSGNNLSKFYAALHKLQCVVRVIALRLRLDHVLSLIKSQAESMPACS